MLKFYNRDEKCLLRGTNWVFKSSGPRFVFKWLIYRVYTNNYLKHVTTLKYTLAFSFLAVQSVL
jgi:hypothetical protein